MLRTLQVVLWLAVVAVSAFLAVNSFSPSLFRPLSPADSVPLTPAVLAPKLDGVDYARHPYHVVNFFASWCIPCQVEHSLLVALNANFPVIGVAWKDQPEDSRQFLTRFPGGFDQVLHDAGGDIGLDWRIKGIPATYVVNAAGKLVYQRHGLLLDRHYEEIVALIKP